MAIMVDVEELIDYMKLLRKGFDKDLFQSKIDELAYMVDNDGLEYDDFHTFFKVWLNLSIPITKWLSIGICLVPKYNVEERTVDYALRWILANCSQQASFSRVGFLLDWLTAAMDCEAIDMVALDCGYGIFYDLLMTEVLMTHTLKLIYTLTKPADVTRRRVIELLDCAKKNSKKTKQFQVLLGLFKSYKPDCVPEKVPAISVNTTFKKINVNLINRFKRTQFRSNGLSKETHLLWAYPMNSDRGNRKKVEPLVPNMTYCNVGSEKYTNSGQQKNYLDFNDPVSLWKYSLQHKMSRPARLRALLCNKTGLMLLAVTHDTDHDFLSRDLCHIFKTCYLNSSGHSYIEKQDFLFRLTLLQRTLMQGIPIVTDFLAQFLPLWNEKDYFPQVLELCEWVNVGSTEHVACIVDTLACVYHRSQPMEQCAILNALTNMYINVVHASTRKYSLVLNNNPSETEFSEVLTKIGSSITEMCNKGLQVNPDDIRVSYSSIRTIMYAADSEARALRVTCLPPPTLCLAAPFLDYSAALLDMVALLALKFRKIFVSNKNMQDESFLKQKKVLQAFTCDLIRCFYEEDAFVDREKGYVFHKLPSEFVDRLIDHAPESNAAFSFRNGISFAPLTYVNLEIVDDASSKLWFKSIECHLPNLSEFFKKTLPELR